MRQTLVDVCFLMLPRRLLTGRKRLLYKDGASCSVWAILGRLLSLRVFYILLLAMLAFEQLLDFIRLSFINRNSSPPVDQDIFHKMYLPHLVSTFCLAPAHTAPPS